MSLLERDGELRVISAAADAAAGGRGSVIVVSGPAGVGKSALLGAVLREDLPLRPLLARGGELERELPLGLARQLLEPAIAELAPDAELLARAGVAAEAIVGRSAALDGDVNAILHGLHALVAGLGGDRPLLLVADDVQWADAASLRFLAFLAHRIAGMPALLLLARRSGEPATDEAALVAIAGEPHARERLLAPLSVPASTRLVRDVIGAQAAERFCRVCHDASGGNPFVLRELLHALRQRGVTGDNDAAAEVLGAGPPSVARWVLARLARLSGAAVELAQAVAVLGQETDLGRAARLAGLSLDEAESALDALVEIHVLAPGRPLDFIHPIVRAAVHDAMPVGSRSGAHRRAAHLLLAQDAAPGAVAMHLLATEPSGEPWVAEALLDAARVALAQGAPDVAAAHVHRALAEPAPKQLRPALLRALGIAERRVGRRTADERFLSALEAIADPRERAETLLDMLNTGGPEIDVVAELREAIATVMPHDPELALRLRARLLLALELSPDANEPELRAAERVLDASPQSTLGTRLVAGMLAQQAAQRGRPRQPVQELALRAVADDLAYAEDLEAGYPHIYPLDALAWTDELDLPERRLLQAVADAERRGSLVGSGIALFILALTRLRKGALGDAAHDAQRALEIAQRTNEDWLIGMAVATLVEVLVERGDLERAATLLDRHRRLDGSGPYGLRLTLARSGFCLAAGKFTDAHDTAMAVGRAAEPAGIRNPVMTPWRPRGALALVALGRSADARTLAADALDIAETADVPSAIGEARRVLALTGHEGADIALLDSAVSVLETAPAPIELARALLDLGAALRRNGQRQASREPLSRALEIAHQAGATLVAAAARDELRAAGARPRRAMRTGVDALTASERRIADLAAAGLTNAQIAAQLFITPKTVEHHLGAVYRKLDIRSRRQLAAALLPSS